VDCLGLAEDEIDPMRANRHAIVPRCDDAKSEQKKEPLSKCARLGIGDRPRPQDVQRR
jgi:hypothetical protein